MIDNRDTEQVCRSLDSIADVLRDILEELKTTNRLEGK